MNNHSTYAMDDPNVPVAYATPVTTNFPGLPVSPSSPLSSSSTTTTTTEPRFLEKGRSQRVVVPHHPSIKQLSVDEQHMLTNQGFSYGLIQAMYKNNLNFPLRIWVIDNSGSMAMGDGHRIVETKTKNVVQLVGCSRWTELVETVHYHCQMAALMESPTVFRLLNDPGPGAGPQQFSIGEHGPERIPHELQLAQQTMKNVTPSGVTPLAQHVLEIRANILQMQQELVSTGRKVVLVLATDGLPTDFMGYSGPAATTEFERTLRSLEGLPIWIVIRLCTDEDAVVDYYNNLDAQLELSLEVLDDFVGEAKEVYQQNPWLNYALPLHRMREMGFSHRLLDLLDERRLTKDELREFMVLLFGQENLDGLPDPQVDWHGFLEVINVISHQEAKQWNPITKRLQSWVDMKKLKHSYDTGGCIVM